MIQMSIVQTVHFVFVWLSLGAAFLSLLFSFFYLIQQWQLKHKKPLAFFSRLSSLETIDRFAMKFLSVGFVAMSVLLVTGIYLAHERLSKDWMYDKKIIVAFSTWLWFVFTLVLRYRLGLRGDKFFYSIMIGMLFLITSYLLAQVT